MPDKRMYVEKRTSEGDYAVRRAGSTKNKKGELRIKNGASGPSDIHGKAGRVAGELWQKSESKRECGSRSVRR